MYLAQVLEVKSLTTPELWSKDGQRFQVLRTTFCMNHHLERDDPNLPGMHTHCAGLGFRGLGFRALYPRELDF